MKNLKTGDRVKMVNCVEADHYKGKIWTCRSDSYKYPTGDKEEVVLLEDYAGAFVCEYLAKV